MPIPRHLIMTLIGRDRPGLVQRVAKLVHEYDGNWLESRMSHLGGQFAGMLRVEISSDRETELVNALEALDVDGLTVVVSTSGEEEPKGAGLPANLEIVGHDRPGIVRQITRVLAEKNVNVEELDTDCSSAPMSGESLFQARAHLKIPHDCDLSELRFALERIASDLMVECRLDQSGEGTP